MAEERADVTVVRNGAEERFEIRTGGEPAFLTYSISDGEIVLLHTEVPEALSGNGLGSELVRAALEHARSEGLVVVPLCPFVQAYLRRHPEYRGLARPGGSGA
ncbi:MAG TPA: GNAT family N-acetyltransferase [Longimicrobiaceae bacterium]|nr:GNAT family N-acetyltransferase [Longimicrobiaceae bacterium]